MLSFMPRMARLVIPDRPHHVTQRGVRSMRIFYSAQDRRAYLGFLGEQLAAHDVSVLAYCLMTNHVHLIAVPRTAEGLAKAIGRAHFHYTRRVNFRQNTRGYLFQGRFYSCVLDEPYFLSAVRYVELNPVRARMVSRAWDYGWSSARFHVGLRKNDPLVADRDLLGMERRWRSYLRDGEDHADVLRKKTRTGKSCGDTAFVRRLERKTSRKLLPGKPGPKPRPER